MFLSKASVVLVSILGTSWLTGDTFVSAGPLSQGYIEQMPQGYNQPMPQGYNQQMPQGDNQLMPQRYNQQMPQGYNQQMPQGHNQSMPQGYNQPMPQGYNQQMQQEYNQPMPQYVPQTRYVYVNSNPQPVAPIYQPPPQVIYFSAPSASNSDNRLPLIRTWDGVHDWVQDGPQACFGQNPLTGRK